MPVFLITKAAVGDALWEPVEPLPVGAAGFAQGVVAGQILVVGGTCWQGEQKRALDTVLAFDPATASWREIGRLPWAFAYGGFTAFGDSLCLIGGDDGTATRSNGWTAGVDGTNRARGDLPARVTYCGSVRHENHLYVLGGTEDLRDLGRSSAAFWRVGRSGQEVERLPDFPAGGIIHAALAEAGGRIIVFPGGKYAQGERRLQNTGQAWLYEPAKALWKEIAAYPFAVRGLTVCALDEKIILVAGGFRDAGQAAGAPGFTAEYFLYDVVHDCYLRMPPMPYAAMQIGLVKHGDWLYLMGGEDRQRHRSAAVNRVSVAALRAAALD